MTWFPGIDLPVLDNITLTSAINFGSFSYLLACIWLAWVLKTFGRER